jgi:DNA polymerase III subunit delta
VDAALVAVVVGDEELLVERAVAEAVSAAAATAAAASGGDGDSAGPGEGDSSGQGRGGDGDSAGPGSGTVGADVHEVAAASLAPGQLTALASPSLFGGGCVVVVTAAQDASKDVAAELARLARSPAPDVYLIITHSGGAKNKSLLADLLDAGARRIDCPSVKRFGERMDFLRAEFRRAGRRADDGGLRALLDAVGNDLRDLAAACGQLSADTTGVISQPTVARYYRGRAEATGFSVADRACEGNLAAALEQLRWALATGTSPVLVSSALAQGLRTLGLVGSTGRGLSANAAAAELGMPPWKVDRARQQLRGWTAQGLATAHAAVAEADVQVKGEGVSAAYALERAITTIVACRGQAEGGRGSRDDRRQARNGP